MKKLKDSRCENYYKCGKERCDHFHLHTQHEGCKGYCIDTGDFVECFNTNDIRKKKLEKLNNKI